jgi:hypothetical protein
METGESNPLVEIGEFDISLSTGYHLSIQLGIEHFSYCLLNTTTFTYDYIKNYSLNSKDNTATEISEIINKDAILKAEFFSQSIAFVNFPSTLVPDKLYKEEEAKTLLAFNTKVIGTVLVDKIMSQQAYLIYSVPESILTIVSNFFPNAKYKAQDSILIEQYSKLNNEKKNTYIYLNEQKVSVTIFNGDKMIFNNSFKFTSKEDLLYYVLFSFEQLNISPDTINVTVFGNIEGTDESFSLMYEYIRNIKLGKRPHQFTFPTEFNTLPDHKYFGLFTQILCV